MSRFTKFASAALLVISLAPFAAQAAQTNQFANNGTPVALRHVGGAASDSYGG